MLGSTHPNRRSFVYKKPWRGRLYGRGRLGARKKALLLTTAAMSPRRRGSAQGYTTPSATMAIGPTS